MDELYDVYKKQGCINYDNVFVNKKKCSNKKNTSKTTNSISLSASRPTCDIKSGRKFEFALNISTEQHHIIDILAESRTSRAVEKNILPQAVCLNYISTNTQNHTVPVIHKQPETENIEPLYLTRLSKIHNNLWIGSWDSIEEFIKFGKTIINFSENIVSNSKMPACKHNINTYNISYKDSTNISHSDFMKVFKEVRSIINDMIDDGPLLLVCTKGVNRSASMAVAYGIITTNMTCNELINYIDDKKTSISVNWNNLTNFRIRRLVRSIQK